MSIMYILKNEYHEECGSEIEPCDVRPYAEAEQDGSYGYEDHSIALNDMLNPRIDHAPANCRTRHPLDWPNRRTGAEQLAYPAHPIYDERRAQREAILACLQCTFAAFDRGHMMFVIYDEPDTMPRWKLGSSI